MLEKNIFKWSGCVGVVIMVFLLGACSSGGNPVAPVPEDEDVELIPDNVEPTPDDAEPTPDDVEPTPEVELMPAGIFTKALTNGVDLIGSDGVTFSSIPENNTTQLLYLAEEIQGSGYLSSIAFIREIDQIADTLCNDVEVKLSHTDLTELADGVDDNIHTGQGSQKTVLSTASLLIPVGDAGSMVDLTVEDPFYYNGKDNLLVEIQRGSCDFTPGLKQVVTATNTKRTNIGVNGNRTVAEIQFSGGDNKLVYSDSVTTASFPFSALSTNRKVQLLHTAEEIDGVGRIAGIGLITNMPTTKDYTFTVNVRMAHTDLDELTSNFADNLSGPATTLASELELFVPNGLPAGASIWLPMTNTFDYNGTDNVITEISVSSESAEAMFVLRVSSGMIARRLTGAVDAESGTVTDVAYHVNYRFHGGKVGAFYAPGTESAMDLDLTLVGIAFPLSEPEARTQILYRASELGGAGRISKLACRIGDMDFAALPTVTYTVMMAHTTEAMLTSYDFADNFTSPQQVFSGEVDVLNPYLRQGDWHEIVLDSPFDYNGVDNLIVQISGTSTEPYAGCIYNNTLFELSAGRQLRASSLDAASGTMPNSLTDMLFEVER